MTTNPTSPEAIARRIAQRREHHGTEDHDAALLEALAARLAEVEESLAETEALEMQHGAVIDRLTAERDTALAQVAVATSLIAWAYDTLTEINLSNYDHDDVCALNAASVEVLIAFWDMTTPASATAALTAMLDKARGARD